MLNGVQSDVYQRVDAVTPSDVAGNPCLGWMVTVGGTVTFRAVNSSADVQVTAVAGVIYPFVTSFIRNTGTAATGIVALN